jgi:hypothetical protein
MADARNDTPWQQGYVLNPESAAKLGLTHPDAPTETIVVMVSHDCDLIESSQHEPKCEVIIGRRIDSIDGIYTKAKNSRRLHLQFSAGKRRIYVDLLATNKRVIDKESVLNQPFVEDIKLNRDEHFDLQSWLSARYHRAVFADEFDRRLKAKPAEMHKKLANAIKGTGTDLLAILFDVDHGQEIEHGPDDPYLLEIYVVHSVSEDPGRAFDTAKRVASQIRGLFHQYYHKGGQWQHIHLRSSLPISAEAISLNHFRSVQPWNYNYLEIITES